MSDVLTGKLDTIDVEDVLNSKYDSKKWFLEMWYHCFKYKIASSDKLLTITSCLFLCRSDRFRSDGTTSCNGGKKAWFIVKSFLILFSF